MYNQKPKRRFAGITVAGIVSVAILLASWWLLWNRQYVADLANAWMYNPPAAIQAIDERIKLTDKGTFYFHTTRPEIADASSFNQDCPRQEPSSPILGCYVSGRIFIYDVENAQLDGIEEVTAAHEMLHAVWERTDPNEQQRLGRLLQQAYALNATDELKERMAYYQRSEPTQVINELHSILPTELAVIGDELEAYYAQFFQDRKAVIALHSQYSSVFTSLVTQAESLFTELATLGEDIEQRRAQYDADIQRLSNDITSFNQRANAGNFSSMSQFNSERASLVARSSALEAERTALSGLIDTYNAKYEEYQVIATQIDSLNKSIDSISGLSEAPSLE